MKKGEKYFIRIDKKVKETETDQNNYQRHLEYLKKVSFERFFLGGGFNNTKGGMIIYTAKDLNEAKTITEKDPLFENDEYEYELLEWEIVIASN